MSCHSCGPFKLLKFSVELIQSNSQKLCVQSNRNFIWIKSLGWYRVADMRWSSWHKLDWLCLLCQLNTSRLQSMPTSTRMVAVLMWLVFKIQVKLYCIRMQLQIESRVITPPWVACYQNDLWNSFCRLKPKPLLPLNPSKLFGRLKPNPLLLPNLLKLFGRLKPKPKPLLPPNPPRNPPPWWQHPNKEGIWMSLRAISDRTDLLALAINA